MSKSKGNTISPDDYIKEYGSDVFRMYLMFGFGYTDGGAWSDDGLKSIGRFVDRIERILEASISEINCNKSSKNVIEAPEKELNYWRHFAIRGVSEDAEKLQFNTAIARLMEFTNALNKYLNEAVKNTDFLKEVLVDYIKLLAPFAPHFSEEQWENLGMGYSVFNEKWPEFNPAALVKDEVEIAIQINGKIKAKINVATSSSEDEIKEASLNDETIKSNLEGKTVRKVIVIKGRLVNIVAN